MSTATTHLLTSALYDYAQAPIPALPSPSGWRNRGIIVEECGEPLEKVTPEHQDIGIQVVPAYANMRVPGAEQDCFVRRGVLEKLKPVGQALRQVGSGLEILDALRPPPVQGTLFWALLVQLADQCQMSSEQLKKAQEVVPNLPEYGKRFDLNRTDLLEAKKYVDLPPLTDSERNSASSEGLLVFGQRYVSIPSLTGVPAPHFTGGAVDVGIKGLDTGVKFDEFTDRASMRYYEQLSEQGKLPAENRNHHLNRRILFNMMTERGFSCFAFEAWHFGIGDPLSIVCSGSNDKAKYGIKFPFDWRDRDWAHSVRFEN